MRLLGRGLLSQCALPRYFSLCFCGGAFGFSPGTPFCFESLLCFSLSPQACVFFGLSLRAGGLCFGFRFAISRRLTLLLEPLVLLPLEGDQPCIFCGLRSFARSHRHRLCPGFSGFISFGLLEQLLCFHV